MKKFIRDFDFSSNRTLVPLLLILLFYITITFAFVSSLQVLLLLLWGIEQTKLQIFVVVAAIKLITM